MKKRNAWDPKQFPKGKIKGNQRMWESAAKALSPNPTESDDLQILGLAELPATLRELQKARNSAMLKVHPDRGGSNEQAVQVQEAYENLKRSFN